MYLHHIIPYSCWFNVRYVEWCMMNKCKVCINYMNGLERCKYCQFEWDENEPWCQDNWDIFSLNDDYEWSHHQMSYRLHYKGINHFWCDMWTDNNIAVIIGVTANKYKVAKALNINEECIYDWADHSIMIINLYQERDIRDVLETPM